MVVEEEEDDDDDDDEDEERGWTLMSSFRVKFSRGYSIITIRQLVNYILCFESSNKTSFIF